jgi:hypothetical protein
VTQALHRSDLQGLYNWHIGPQLIGQQTRHPQLDVATIRFTQPPTTTPLILAVIFIPLVYLGTAPSIITHSTAHQLRSSGFVLQLPCSSLS